MSVYPTIHPFTFFCPTLLLNCSRYFREIVLVYILGQENVSRTRKIVLSLFVLSYTPQIIISKRSLHTTRQEPVVKFIQLDNYVRLVGITCPI